MELKNNATSLASWVTINWVAFKSKGLGVSLTRAEKTKVLALQLNSGIWAHTVQEFMTVSSLDPGSHEIFLLSCGGLQTSGCIVRESKKRGLEERSKAFDCRNCGVAITLLESKLKGLGFEVTNVNLAAWSLQEDRVFAESLSSATWSDEETRSLKLLGVPIGRIAFFEWYLNSKSTSLTYSGLSSERLARREHSLTNAALVLLSLNRFLTSIEVPSFDVAMCYAPQYSINHGALQLLAIHQPQVKQYFFEGSFHPDQMYKSVQMWDWKKYGLVPPIHETDSWTSPSNEALNQFSEKFLETLSNSKSFMVYSKANSNASSASVREMLGVPEDKSLVLVALSSTDENAAATEIGAMGHEHYPGKVFSSQFDMCKYLLRFWRDNPQYSFILRLHPREFSEERNSNSSQTVDDWKDLVEESDGGFLINTPDHPWSLGDLISASDQVVTGWSSAAVQSVLMGKKTVTYDRGMGFFSKESVSSGTTVEEFGQNILEDLDSVELQRRRLSAAHWLWMNYHEAELDSPSTVRLYFDWIRENSILRKALFALDELLPKTIRALDLLMTGKPSKKDSIRVNMLFSDKLDYLPYRSSLEEDRLEI